MLFVNFIAVYRKIVLVMPLCLELGKTHVNGHSGSLSYISDDIGLVRHVYDNKEQIMTNNEKIAYLVDRHVMTIDEAIENIKSQDGFFGPNAWNEVQGYNREEIYVILGI